MEVDPAVTAVQANNDKNYVWISKHGVVFLKYLSVKSNILFILMDIVFQLKDKGILITVPFCMTKTVLYIYMF